MFVQGRHGGFGVVIDDQVPAPTCGEAQQRDQGNEDKASQADGGDDLNQAECSAALFIFHAGFFHPEE